MARDCPKCGLVSSPEAQRCDCGYDFASRTMQQSYLGAGEPEGRKALTPVEILVCVLIPIVGVVLGILARRKGRAEAGATMLVISLAMLLFCGGLRFLMLAGG